MSEIPSKKVTGRRIVAGVGAFAAAAGIYYGVQPKTPANPQLRIAPVAAAELSAAEQSTQPNVRAAAYAANLTDIVLNAYNNAPAANKFSYDLDIDNDPVTIVDVTIKAGKNAQGKAGSYELNTHIKRSADGTYNPYSTEFVAVDATLPDGSFKVGTTTYPNDKQPYSFSLSRQDPTDLGDWVSRSSSETVTPQNPEVVFAASVATGKHVQLGLGAEILASMGSLEQTSDVAQLTSMAQMAEHVSAEAQLHTPIN